MKAIVEQVGQESSECNCDLPVLLGWRLSAARVAALGYLLQVDRMSWPMLGWNNRGLKRVMELLWSGMAKGTQDAIRSGRPLTEEELEEQKPLLLTVDATQALEFCAMLKRWEKDWDPIKELEGMKGELLGFLRGNPRLLVIESWKAQIDRAQIAA